MPVASEACYAERTWTGVETSLTPDFAARSAAHVTVSHFDDAGVLQPMVAGINFNVTLDSSGMVTVLPLAFPAATPDDPVIVAIERVTPATQDVDFENLQDFDADVHGRLHDAAAMRDAELRGRFARNEKPYVVTNDTVDFRPRRIMAADPVDAGDVATKAYADQVSGADAAGQAAASAAAAEVSNQSAAVHEANAGASAAQAAINAALLGSPDYGFFSAAPSETRDYGSSWA